MGIEFKKRPMCSCGVKMKLERYEGYYDSFSYWICENCNLDNEMQDEEPDSEVRGAYS